MRRLFEPRTALASAPRASKYQVISVMTKKASISLANEDAERERYHAAERRVEYVEGEVERITGLLLQVTDQLQKDQLLQLDRFKRIVAEQVTLEGPVGVALVCVSVQMPLHVIEICQ